MVREVSFKWHDSGYAIVQATSMGVRIMFDNLEVEFSQREIAVTGVYEGMREHMLDSKGTRKVVYIDLAFPARGVKEPSGVVYQRHAEVSLGAFGLIYSPLDSIGSYITVYPPPGSLYDYATVTPDKIAVFMAGRRQVYLLEENTAKKIILV